MQQDYQRTRIHDGLIDQIEIYNEALDLAAVNARYRAVAETIPGDSNFDGVVDGADYSRWADHFRQANTGWSTGDFSGDGVTDAADYTIWADNYSATMTAVTVPEPSAVGLAGLGALLAIAGFRSYPR